MKNPQYWGKQQSFVNVNMTSPVTSRISKLGLQQVRLKRFHFTLTDYDYDHKIMQ